jgi:hypothetical protein
MYRWNGEAENKLCHLPPVKLIISDLKELKETPKSFNEETRRERIIPTFTKTYFEKLSMTIWQIVIEMQETLKVHGMNTKSLPTLKSQRSKRDLDTIDTNDGPISFVDLLRAKENSPDIITMKNFQAIFTEAC